MRNKENQKRYERMLDMRKQGYTLKQIAEEYSVSRQRVAQIVGQYTPTHFNTISKDACIYVGLRNWMNSNLVSVRELIRRSDKWIYDPETHARLKDRLSGRIEFKITEIEAILKTTGLTYEEAFGCKEQEN